MMVLGVGLTTLVVLADKCALVAVVSFLGSALGPGSAGLMLRPRASSYLRRHDRALRHDLPQGPADARVAWRECGWCCLHALLLAAGTLAHRLYLGNAGVGSAYGAAGSLVVLLLWIYTGAASTLRAEFTHVHARGVAHRWCRRRVPCR